MLRDYLPILLQIFVVALFALSALLVSILVGKRGTRTRAKDTAYECGMIPQGERQPRFSVKFYVVAMLFILFDLEIVFMYPWAVVYRDSIRQGEPPRRGIKHCYPCDERRNHCRGIHRLVQGGS